MSYNQLAHEIQEAVEEAIERGEESPYEMIHILYAYGIQKVVRHFKDKFKDMENQL